MDRVMEWFQSHETEEFGWEFKYYFLVSLDGHFKVFFFFFFT